jgi:hypothetical protein
MGVPHGPGEVEHAFNAARSGMVAHVVKSARHVELPASGSKVPFGQKHSKVALHDLIRPSSAELQLAMRHA